MILAPLPGHAPTMLLVADELDRRASTLAATAAVLARLRSRGTSWDSPAGEAFGRLLASMPPHLDLVVDRYAVAADALRHLAAVLEEEQAVIQRAVDEEIDARAHVDAIETEIIALLDLGVPRESVEVQGALTRQRAHLARIVDAQDRHRAAWERYAAADEMCTSRLRAAAEDRLADPLAYRGLHAIHDLGEGLAAVGAMAGAHPLVRALGVAGGALTVVADVGLLAGYREGDALGLAVDGALAFTGGLGSAFMRGATQGGRVLGGVVVVDRTLSVQARIRAGWGTVLKASVNDLRPLARIGESVRTPIAWVPRFKEGAPKAFSALWLREKAALLTLEKQRAALSAQVALATAAGREARQLWFGGAALSVTAKVGDQVVDRIPMRGSPDPPVSSRVCQRAPGPPPHAP